jgi:hypothetical protein
MKMLINTLIVTTIYTVGLPANATPKPTTLEGTIFSYECGDNCYLTIKDSKGKEHSGLCSATACEPWNEVAAMPNSFKGKKVKVTVGEGEQVDGNGTVMGKMDAFDDLQWLDKAAISASPSHCTKDEQTLFSCQLDKKKTVSLCAAKTLTPKAGYLQYRFGKAGKVELALPAKKKGIPAELRLMHSQDDSATYNYVSLMNGENFIYELTSFRQFKATNKEGMATPESSDTLVVRDQRKSMREGDVIFSGTCAPMSAAVDAEALSKLTGVKWEKAGF